MIEALRAGSELPSIVVRCTTAITGSHRLAAWDAEGIEPTVIEISDDDNREACEALYVDYLYECCDCDMIAAVLFEVTDDDDLRDALKDQR